MSAPRPHIWHWLAGVAFVGLLMASVFVDRGDNDVLRILGVASLLLSPFLFVPPFVLLRKYGGAKDGEPFFDKPAFHNWLVAVSFLALGFTELAARLPNALVGLATVLATYFLGRQLYGSRAGFVAGAVLATAGEFFVLSRTVMHDMSLAFFVTLGLTLFFVGYSEGGRGRRWFLLACAAFACNQSSR